jgi:hypothetical protein
MLRADEIAHHVLVRESDPQLRGRDGTENGLDKRFRHLWSRMRAGSRPHGQ